MLKLSKHGNERVRPWTKGQLCAMDVRGVRAFLTAALHAHMAPPELEALAEIVSEAGTSHYFQFLSQYKLMSEPQGAHTVRIKGKSVFIIKHLAKCHPMTRRALFTWPSSEEELDGEVLCSMAEAELLEVLRLTDASLLRLLLPAAATAAAPHPADTMLSPRTPAMSLAAPAWARAVSMSSSPSSASRVAALSVDQVERFILHSLGTDTTGADDDDVRARVSGAVRGEEIDGECLAAMSEEEYQEVLGRPWQILLSPAASLTRIRSPAP